MGARTDAARAEVVARRELLLHETTHLEAAARSAVDVPSKVKRNPVQSAGLAAGTAFVVLGGPQRVFHRVRRAVQGPKADMPKSMLPKDVDKRLRSMGDDGEAVRRILEREFADYLDKTKKERESKQLGALLVTLAGSVLRPVVMQAGKRAAQQYFSPESTSFADAVQKIQQRREAGKGQQPGVTTTPSAGAAPGTAGTSKGGTVSPGSDPQGAKR